jgi:hypothetical protein
MAKTVKINLRARGMQAQRDDHRGNFRLEVHLSSEVVDQNDIWR